MSLLLVILSLIALLLVGVWLFSSADTIHPWAAPDEGLQDLQRSAWDED